MCAGSIGTLGRCPGSSMFQYTHLNASLPMWFRWLSSSSEKGPRCGSGNVPSSGSMS